MEVDVEKAPEGYQYLRNIYICVGDKKFFLTGDSEIWGAGVLYFG